MAESRRIRTITVRRTTCTSWKSFDEVIGWAKGNKFSYAWKQGKLYVKQPHGISEDEVEGPQVLEYGDETEGFQERL